MVREDNENRGSSLLPALDEDADAAPDDNVPKAGNVDVSKRHGEVNAAKLSVTSQQYDRTGKGYLDGTEKKLRALDTDNKGELDLDKVYYIMNNLERQQEKTATLKNMVIALALFATVLALTNIGTSFAAARLAKDTEVENDNAATVNLVDRDSRNVLGTSSYSKVIDSNTVPDGAAAGRYLQEAADDKMYWDEVLGHAQALCHNYDPDTWNGSCGGSSTTSTVNKCGVVTKFAMQRLPTSDDAGVTTFYFQAYRSTHSYGEVVITCPAGATSTTLCDVEGFTCGEYCTHTGNDYVCDHGTDLGKPYCSCQGCSVNDEDLSGCLYTSPPTVMCCDEGDCCPSSAPSPLPTPKPSPQPSSVPTPTPTKMPVTPQPTTCHEDVPKLGDVCLNAANLRVEGCCCPGQVCVKRDPWPNRHKCHVCDSALDDCSAPQVCTTVAPTPAPQETFKPQAVPPSAAPSALEPSAAPSEVDSECPNRKMAYLHCGDHANCFRTWHQPDKAYLDNPKNENKNGWVISMLKDDLKCNFYQQLEAVGDNIQACIPNNMDEAVMPKLAEVLFNALSGNMTVSALEPIYPYYVKELRFLVYESNSTHVSPPIGADGYTTEWGPDFTNVVNLQNGTQVYEWTVSDVKLETDKWFGIFYGVFCDE